MYIGVNYLLNFNYFSCFEKLRQNIIQSHNSYNIIINSFQHDNLCIFHGKNFQFFFAIKVNFL